MAFSKIFFRKFNHTIYLVFLKCISDRSSVVRMLTIFKRTLGFENIQFLHFLENSNEMYSLSIIVVFFKYLDLTKPSKIVINIHNVKKKWNRKLFPNSAKMNCFVFSCKNNEVLKSLLKFKKNFKTMTILEKCFSCSISFKGYFKISQPFVFVW